MQRETLRLIGVAVAVAALALAACSGGDEPATDQPTSTVPAVTEPARSPATRSPVPATTPGASPADTLKPTEEEILEPVESATQPETSTETEEASSNSQPEVPEVPPDPEEGLHRVVDVEHCLNVRAEPYIEAKIVDCIPLGASVETGLVVEGPGGVIWRGLGGDVPPRGWVSDRYLEGPEPEHILTLPSYVAPEEFPRRCRAGYTL